ncbi:hypothetical protein JCM6882_005364 [Rhodosporidiobolus microsporus]
MSDPQEGSDPPRRLAPLDTHPQRASSTSLLDAYFSSPSPRADTTFAQQQQTAQQEPLAASTAIDRPLSPSGGARAGTEAEGGTGGGLLRRSSSRVRRASEADAAAAGSGPASAGRSASGDGQEEGAVQGPRSRTTSEQGWRTFREEGSTASMQPPQRAGTVELSDGSVVRRLPSTPGEAALPPPRNDFLAASTSSSSLASHSSSIDDPFRASSSSASPPALFSPAYSVSTSAAAPLSRVESHPLSLAPSMATGRSSFDADAEPAFGRSHRFSSEDDEEAEARSPLQPTHFSHTSPSTSPNRRRTNVPAHSSSRVRRSPFLAPLSTSPSRLFSPKSGAADPDTSHGSLGTGWREISPARSPGGAESGIPKSASGSGLSRRGTLSAMAGGLRRMSVRVVNVTGAAADEEDDAATAANTSALSRSPSSLRRARRRSSAVVGAATEGMTLAERRASRAATLAPPTKRIGEEDEDGHDEQGAADDVLDVEEEEKATWEEAHEKNERSYRKLRGRTLGVFGPENALRRACAVVLTSGWTEPTILLLIVLQVVVLTIQSSYDVYTHPRPERGYFHSWEDYTLFAIFVFFSVEIVARVIVTGLVINPPLPPAPPAPKVDLYGGNAINRSPSVISRIQSRLSPLPSPLNSPLPSPSSARRFPLSSPTRSSHLPPPSPTHLTPVPLSPVKPSSSYPPAPPRSLDPRPSTDIASLGYAQLDGNESSVALVRDNSHAPSTPSGPRGGAGVVGGFGIGLGLSTPSGTSSPSAASNPFSIRNALASNLQTAAGAAASTAFAPETCGDETSATFLGARGAKANAPYLLSIRRQRQSYQQAFLRHSWNRIDAVAVVSFWISFALAVKGWEAPRHLFFFRALSVLRATRLLAVTAGTQTILHSLKKASPMLADVGMFVAFAMVLFSIIGVQAFRGSYRRTCMWIDPTGVFENVTDSAQHCGGYIDRLSGNETGYLLADFSPSGDDPKGYICGAPSVCVDTGNPANGAWSFDNIFASLMQVFIIASANTWTANMYDMMNSDYFVSCLFFICALVCVNYWLYSIFIACVTTAFADIRDVARHSAFSTTTIVPAATKFDDHLKPHRALSRGASVIRKLYDKTSFVWVLAVLASVAIEAATEYNISPSLARTYKDVELGLTLAFDVEIAIRLFASLPEWRSFFESKPNCVDLALAVITSIMQIPPVVDSRAYAWLTFFQLARFYRVILFIPRMKRLLVRVLGTFTGLLNMLFFLVLMNFIAALVAVQLLRGVPDPDSDDTGVLNFYQIYNAFLAMYQISSSENWTTILTTALGSEKGQWQVAITVIFLCGWMFLSFFVLGNLFIAVINENFAIAEEEKRARQIEAFVNRTIPGKTSTAGWFRRFDPYAYVTAKKKPSTDVLTSETTLVQEPEELPDRNMTASPEPMDASPDEKEPSEPLSSASSRFMDKAKKSIRFQSVSESVANYVDPHTPDVNKGRYRHPRDGSSRSREATFIEQERVQEEQQERRNEIADFIEQHPSYDKALWIFSNSSPIRRFCQSLCDPSYGNERINGRAPDPTRKRVFSAVVFVAIVASITVAGVATPMYRHDYYLDHGAIRWTWYNLVEASLGAIFFSEAAVKWIADGFLFTPNGYLLSLWNDIDFFVLVTLIINIVTSLMGGTSSSRFTRALKAFRALRLINLSATMRTTFYNVLIVGAGRILDASILAALYIIPFAIWGMAIFRGRLYSCNDSSVRTKAECAGEYLAETVDGWSYLAPRVWSNPSTWSFDSFHRALLIMFEIISLEGWIDVMESVMQIVGVDRQPEENAGQWNALFFVAYNLVGVTFILTLFVSLIIQNFAERTSASLLTTEQRQWLDLRRYITRQHPSRRPKHRPSSSFRSWCFDRAVSKHGWWSRSVTVLYCLNILVLCTQAETTSGGDDARNYIFLGFTLLYAVDIAVRITGLGTSFFRSGWSLYDLVVVVGTVGTTIPILIGATSQTVIQLQKLFLVAIVLKLAQRNNSLNQLFKTAAASLPAILNILGLWLVAFLVFAIFYIELFGLTRWGSAGSHNSNYETFFSAMVLLALQSTGEGWNEYMHNYTVEWPQCTNSLNYLFSDCGSAPGAYSLFIVWNILSMYLFVNLLLGAVIENFSFAFQAYGKVTGISREQMRGFKKLWAQFDPEQTGHLQPRDLAAFLHRLSTVFEVRIYREEWSVRSLQGAARRDPTDQHNSPSFYHYLGDRDTLSLKRLDLPKLRSVLAAIDVEEVRQRREIYLHVYHEAKLEAEASYKGISFNKMLTLIAHYRLIDDDNALQMEELSARRQQQAQVVERVQIDRVHSFLLMTVLRRRYLAQRQAAKRTEMGAPVPAIHVVGEGSPSPSPAASRFGTPIMSTPTPPSQRRRNQQQRADEGAADVSAEAGDESVLETPSKSRPSVSFAPGTQAGSRLS